MKLRVYDSGVREFPLQRVLTNLDPTTVQPEESAHEEDASLIENRDSEENLEVIVCEAHSLMLGHRAPKRQINGQCGSGLPAGKRGVERFKAEEAGCMWGSGMGLSSSTSDVAQPLVSSEGEPEGGDNRFRAVGNANTFKDKKCGPLGEDAGSATSHGVEIAKGQIDIVQRPEVKSPMKDRCSRKRKVNKNPTPSNKGKLKEKHAAQKIPKETFEKPCGLTKTSLKKRNCLREEVCQVSKYRHKETVAGQWKKLNKEDFFQACSESLEQDESQMELQVHRKHQQKSKKMASRVQVIEGVDSSEFHNKSGKRRKILVDASKFTSNSSRGSILECTKKKVIETSKQQTSSGHTRETVRISTLGKSQTSSANLTKGGSKKTAPLFKEKLVAEDLCTDVQTSETMTAHKDITPDEAMTLCNSKVVETDSYHCTGLGIVESFVNTNKAEKGEYFDHLAANESADCLETNTVLNTSSHHVLHTEGLNLITSGEDVSNTVTKGKCLGEYPDLVTVVSAKVGSIGTKAGSAVGWVMCDDCWKWRCISTELADMIEATNARWTCLENPNKAFANCSVPQEKSSAQINAELDLSDDTVYEGDDDNEAAVDSNSVECFQGRRPATWTLIRHNIFRHRRRKTHDNDDSMVCHCKPPENGGRGCGDNCINRMVCVECVPEICPCGEACSNQQFRKRMYANLELFRCGNKGFGLKALENIPKGTFIVEYVGEVLDMPTFEARQKEYARSGQKHYYFMTLNSSEVIDAHAKGNLGRFINHSCEPNCQTEKWWVDGEISIGLFAIRDLVQGEEITFNYHYEPVYGAAAKGCLCGSSLCRGYIGGESLNLNSIVQSDSDGDDPEPIMLKEESEEETSILQEKLVVPAKKFGRSSEAASWEPDMAVAGRLKRKRSLGTKPEELNNCLRRFSQSKHSEDSTFAKKNSGTKVPIVETNVGRHDWCGTSKLIQPSEVERKLDALLDMHGGLVKRKDVAEQYMRLLVSSAASGETFQEGTSWSVRDLSLLLDAVLKTSSRSALSNVLQKNGLQLLHVLIKQSRRTWKRIPILRKLMKVLELLFTRKVLTEIHISSIPSQPGVESFLESILELTRHDDTEVQQIARRFKAKWLPMAAIYVHHSFSDKNLKSQSWWSNSHQPSQQRSLSGKFSSPPFPEESSALQSMSSKFAVQPVSCKSAVSAAKCSSLDHSPHPANGFLEKKKLFEGERKGSENSCFDDATLPDNPGTCTLEQGSSRRNRVSRWDQPVKIDNTFSNCHHPLRDAVYDEHKHAIGTIGVQKESSQFLTNPEAIRTDSGAICMSEYVGCPSTDQDFRKPHHGFKHTNQPPMPQQSSLHSAMRSGSLREGISSSPSRPGSHQAWVQGGPQKMRARVSHAQSFTGTVPAQQCYLPPFPISPFQSPQVGACPPASHGMVVSTLPCRKPGSSTRPSPHFPHVPRQIPNGLSQAQHITPPRADFGDLQNTTVRGPGQSCPAGAIFPSRRAAPSSGFVSGFKNQGKYQKAQRSSGSSWPYNTEAAFRLAEPFHCQGPQSLSANKLPMHQLGPSAIGGSRDGRSDAGDEVGGICHKPMDNFEPEPPVPGL